MLELQREESSRRGKRKQHQVNGEITSKMGNELKLRKEREEQWWRIKMMSKGQEIKSK